MKDLSRNLMTALPENYRHIDWATYGLHWLLRLSEHTGDDAHSDKPVFAHTDAYRLFSDDPQGRRTNLDELLKQSSKVSFVNLPYVKAFSAGLRYAYLSGFILERVEVAFYPESSSKWYLAFELIDEAAYYLEEIDNTVLPSNADVLLQSGDPAQWFNMNYWSQIQPIDEHRNTTGRYPLSRASHCQTQHFDALQGLGAICSSASFWYPPPATSSTEMHDYLYHHPQLSSSVAQGTGP